MTSSISLVLLETKSCEVTKKTSFNSRYTTYIPDFFFIFLYVSIFFTSALLDRLFIFLTVINGQHMMIASLFFASTLAPLIYSILLEKDFIEFVPEWRLGQWFLCILKLMLIIFGLDSVIIGGKVLTDAFAIKKNFNEFPQYYSFPFFHISNGDLSIVKFYCCIISEFKSIPQLFLACIFIMVTKMKGAAVHIAFASILLNTIIFSYTMAITLPIRKTPRLFKTCKCVLLNSFSKFMATTCACGMNLVIFTAIFKQAGYTALTVHGVRFLWAVWPCWRILKNETSKIPQLYLIFHGLFFAIIFSFIYIHPFEGKGKLFYYYFYLLNFLTEIASIYLLTDANYEIVIIYFALKVLLIGFLSCFGLVNILHTDKIVIVENKKSASDVFLLKKSESTNDSPENKKSDSDGFLLKKSESTSDSPESNKSASDVFLFKKSESTTDSQENKKSDSDGFLLKKSESTSDSPDI